MLHKGNLPPPHPPCSFQSYTQRSWRSSPVIWWPRRARNIKVASSWFNLGNAFLDMVFKHFGNETAHNGLAWTLYFLSRLSSWASPSGLAPLQKQTLHSYVPVSLLTSAAITSDCHAFVSRTLFIKSNTDQLGFWPAPTPERGTGPEIQLPPYHVLIFMTETLQRGITCFWKNFEHLWCDKVMARYQEGWESKMEGKLTKSAFKFLKKDKKKIFLISFLLIPLREDRLGPSMHPGRKQATGKATWGLIVYISLPLDVSSLWTNEGTLAASSFLPHPK